MPLIRHFAIAGRHLIVAGHYEGGTTGGAHSQPLRDYDTTLSRDAAVTI